MPKLGRRSERAELDYRMAPDITRKDAPFGTSETPTITMKIIGGRQIPVIEKHPVGIDSHGSRIQPLQPITEKPNHLDPRTYGDNPAGYYNTVQPTTLISKRPDSKDISRVHYKALPPIQANRTRNDMSTVFEKETWTAHREPQLAKETEYKTNYFSDSHLNEMDAKRYSSQRRDHLRVEPEEYEQLLRIMPPNVFLPNDPIDYSRLEPILTRLIAGEMESGNPQELKDVYLEASQHDRDLRGYCSLEVLDNCLQRHKFHIPDLRLVAAKYVDPLQPGKINYEKTLSFLERAVKLKDGDITEDSRLNTPKRLLEDMAETEALRSDRPKYYMSNGETNKLGYYYKDGEVAKLLRTVENELSKSSYFMDWTKWNNAFNKMDRDHRETLSASQIKDICYDNKLPLSDSIVNQILALCEDNNRDGQYRWNDFLDFLSRVRPSNTGLPIPVSKRPLDYAKRIPEPVANWPRTDANTSPERHSPRKESPHREPSPDKRGYADRAASPTKPAVQANESVEKVPDSQELVKSPVKQIKHVQNQADVIRKPEPSNRECHSPDRQSISPSRQLEYYRTSPVMPGRQNMSPNRSPSRLYENYRVSPASPDMSTYRHIDNQSAMQNQVDDHRSRYYRTYGQYRSNNNPRESRSPDRRLSFDQNDNQQTYYNGGGAYNQGSNTDRTYRNEQSRYVPSWQDTSRWKSPSPAIPRNSYHRNRQYPDEMRYLNRDSYDNYMNTWAQQHMRGQWPDSRYNRPKSYAEPTRHHDGHKSEGTGRVRPLSYKENMSGGYGYDASYGNQPGGMRTPVRRNRSLSPVRQPSPDRGMRYPETARDVYRVPNPDLYREAYSQNYSSSPYGDNQQYSQYPANQASYHQSRFDGPPRGYGDHGDYGYDRRDGYGYDDYQRPGQYRYDGHQKSDREHQIKQLTTELRDLESKYHMTREAMKSHEKPWPDRYLKLAEALYNSDVSNKGYLHKDQVLEIVRDCNDMYKLGLDLGYVESLVTMRYASVDSLGNVLLKPFLTNLSGASKNSVNNVIHNNVVSGVNFRR